MDDRKQRKNQDSEGVPLMQNPRFIPPTKDVPQERRCPICWTGYGGVGQIYHAKSGIVRHYKCNECGHSWSYDPTKHAIRYTIEQKLPK